MFCAEEYKKLLAKSETISDMEAVPLPLVRDDQNYIFISYSHQDYKQVYSDLADMYEAGVRFWYDRGLTPGKDWDAMVTEKIQNPRCSGVIFFLSKNLFLSRAIKREISIVTGRDEITGQEESGAKAYFSVNLTEGVPSDIVFSITPAEKQEKKLDSRWLKLLMDTFTDESTYLKYTAPNHASALVEAICDTFNVVSDPDVMTLAEGDYAGQTLNGRRHGQGTFTYTTGHVYEGQWEDDLRCGNGILSCNGKVIYEGQWKDDKYHGYGEYTYNNGTIYAGYWEDGLCHGQGTCTYADGIIYEGEWAKGQRHGHGTCTYADGAVYEGQWAKGQRHGQGTYIYGDEGEHKRTYVGQWCEGQMEGKGLFTYADQSTYEGDFVDGKFHGYGLRRYANGCTYEGGWEKGKQNGQGVYTYSDGKSWTGEFKDDKMWTGQGFWYYFSNGKRNGKTYEGETREGECHGYGRYTYADGAVYEGQWEKGKRHGQGTYVYGDEGEHKRTYVGQWTEDRMEGKGLFTYADQSTYEGDFVDWKFQGYGVRRYKSGVVYAGQWEKGKQNGQGVYTYSDGKTWTGEFKDDRMWTGQGFWYYFSNGKRNGKTYEGETREGECHGYGRYTYADGAVYEGQWEKGKRHGQGTYVYGDEGEHKRTYVGQWTEDRMEGKGLFTYADQSTYEGDFVDWKFHGYGHRRYANGCSYEGSWKMDKQNGRGVYAYSDGKTWTGEFKDNKMWTGKGFWYYFTDGKRNGKTYEGEAVNGLPHGHGKYVYADGSFYEGEFQAGKRHGQGVYESLGLCDDEGPMLRYQKGGTWVKDKLVEGWEASLRRGKDGAYKVDARKEGKWDYAGNPLGVMIVTSAFGTTKKLSLPGMDIMLPNWKIMKYDLDKAIWQFEGENSAAPNGKGRAVCYDGTVIEGFFLDGKVDESRPCTVTYTDGCVYVGTLRLGLRHGDGIMTAPSGSRYDGRWVDDALAVGEVVMRNEDGSIYTGHWRNGRRSGRGKLVRPDGTEVSGIWENGKLVHQD